MKKISIISGVLLSSAFASYFALTEPNTIVCQIAMNEKTLEGIYMPFAEKCEKYGNDGFLDYCKLYNEGKLRAETCKKSGFPYKAKKTFIFDVSSSDKRKTDIAEGFVETCWGDMSETHEFKKVTTPSSIQFIFLEDNDFPVFSIDRSTLEGKYPDQQLGYTCEVLRTFSKNKI